MRDPYQVLGVSPGVPDEEIKRAFRRLAKQLHPDLRPGDADASRRFQELVSAYQALSGNGVTAAMPSRPARLSLAAQAATMAAVFVLTVGTVAILLMVRGPHEAASPTAEDPRGAAVAQSEARPQARPQRSAETEPAEAALARPGEQQPAKGIEDGAISRDPDKAAVVASGSPAAASPQEGTPGTARETSVPSGRDGALAWVEFRNTRHGFSLAYPAAVFSSGPVQTDEGTAFRSPDGRATLSISAAMTGMPLAVHKRTLVDGPYKGAAIDYAPRRTYWFVLSGILGDSIFYHRVTLSCDKRMVHGWKLVYPLAERGFYDRITEEMHRRYRHSNGARARCGETEDGGGILATRTG